MKASDKREVLYEGIAQSIEVWRRNAEAGVVHKRDSSQEPSEAESPYTVLGKYVESEEARQALDKVIYDALEGLAHSILNIFDEGAGPIGDLHLAILDKDTKQDLAPRNGEYHYEFLEYIMDREES